MNFAMAQDVSVDSAQQARIRIFGQNGKPTNMKYSFQGHEVKESTGGSLGGAFASSLGLARNSTIGIPATATLDTMNDIIIICLSCTTVNSPFQLMYRLPYPMPLLV